MNGNEQVVPASLLGQIKLGLIQLGYATQETPLEFIQDCYFKYCLVRQTGFNPNIPYSLCLLPKSLREQLGVTGCGGTDPEPDLYQLITPNPNIYLELIDQIKNGIWTLNSSLFPNPSTDIHGSEDIAIRKDSRGTVVDIKDGNIVSLQDSTRVVVKKSIPTILLIGGFTDEIYNALINGDSEIEAYINNGTSNWWLMNPSQLQTFIKKNNIDGQYYFVFSTNTLDVVVPNILNQVAIDEDGEGADHAKYTGTLNLNFGEILDAPDILGLRTPFASEYTTLADSIKSSAWNLSNLLGPDQSIFYGSETLKAIDIEGGKLKFDVLNAGAVSSQTETSLILNSLFPVLVEITGVTDSIATEILAGNSPIKFYMSFDDSTWSEIPAEQLPYLLNKNPADGKYYIVTTSNTLHLNVPANQQRFAIDPDGSGTKTIVTTTCFLGNVAEAPVGDTVNLVIPDNNELSSLYADLRSGDWNLLTDTNLNPSQFELLPESDYTLTALPNQYKFTPVVLESFQIDDYGIYLKNNIFANIYKLDGLTDEGATALIDGSSTKLGLYLGQNVESMQKVVPQELEYMIKKNPTNGNWYVFLPVQSFYFDTSLSNYLAFDDKGDGIKAGDTLLSMDIVGDEEFKPLPYPGAKVETLGLDKNQTKSLYESLVSGEVALPTGLGISASDLVDPANLVFDESPMAIATAMTIPNPEYMNRTGLVSLVCDPDATDSSLLGYANFNNGKKIITFIKVTGLDESNPETSLRAFVSGNTPYMLFKCNVANSYPSSLQAVTFDKGSNPAQEDVDALLSKFIINDPTYGTVYCEVFDAIGTLTQNIYTAGRDSFDVSLPQLIGYYRSSKQYTVSEGAGTEIAPVYYFTGGSSSLITKPGGGSVEGLIALHDLNEGDFVTFSLATLIDQWTKDTSLTLNLNIALVPSSATLQDLLNAQVVADAQNTRLVNFGVDAFNPGTNHINILGTDIANYDKIKTLTISRETYNSSGNMLGQVLVNYFNTNTGLWTTSAITDNSGSINVPDFKLDDYSKIALWLEVSSFTPYKATEIRIDTTPVIRIVNPS